MTYSKIVTVDFNEGLKVKTFPNPFSQALKVELTTDKNLNGDVVMGLYDITGKQVWNKKMDGKGKSFNFSIPTDSFASGGYLIRVQAGGYTWQEKVIKQ